MYAWTEWINKKMKAKGTHSELCREKLMEFDSTNVEYYSLGIGHIDHRARRLTWMLVIFQTEKPHFNKMPMKPTFECMHVQAIRIIWCAFLFISVFIFISRWYSKTCFNSCKNSLNIRVSDFLQMSFSDFSVMIVSKWVLSVEILQKPVLLVQRE